MLYIPHGGGPLPLLGDPGHRELVTFLRGIPEALPRPRAILVISAHWEEEVATVQAGPHPDMLYDYTGFPPESYQLSYAAPGSPELAEEIVSLLRSAGIQSSKNTQRGYDHGLFIPLMLMYPDADIPCLQLSLRKDLDPQFHLALGETLAPLREPLALDSKRLRLKSWFDELDGLDADFLD